VAVAALVAVTLVTQRRDPPATLTDVDGQPLPLCDRLGCLRPTGLF